MHSFRLLATALGLSLLMQAGQAQTTDTALVGRVYPIEAAESTPAFSVQCIDRTTGGTRVLGERAGPKTAGS